MKKAQWVKVKEYKEKHNLNRVKPTQKRGAVQKQLVTVVKIKGDTDE